MPKLIKDEEVPPSGLRESGRCLAHLRDDEPPLDRPLFVALAYWPNRWPRVVVLAALAMSSSSPELTPIEWTEVLDGIAHTMRPMLRAPEMFP